MERFKLKPAVYLILEKDDHYLLSLRQNTGHMDNHFSLVAGHLDGGETCLQGMVREAEEEAGIKLCPDHLEVIHFMHRTGDEERMDIFIKANEWQGEPQNLEPEKCGGVEWHHKEQLPENTVPYIRHIFEQIEAGNFYSEFGW